MHASDSHPSLEQEPLFLIRHSLAHIMAQAVLELRPGSKLGFGPPISDGFYYDFILSAPLDEADFPIIEKKMRTLIQSHQTFVREDLPVDAALKRLDAMGEPYKKEYAQELILKHHLKTLSFYHSDGFLDMCEGPHVSTTREIPPDCFKIKSIAGAYWRGNEKNMMMTRLYVWAFENKKALHEHIHNYEEALKRDHKKLGKSLSLFTISDAIGKGLPLWLPNGTVIRDELEKFIKELEFQADYQRITTPLLARTELYHQTGHLPYYASSMFPPMELVDSATTDPDQKKESYSLRPMNCPHHHHVYSSEPRSYRDLPLRFAEYGTVYRYEDSGALSGLLRVRGMCMNDAHIYCTPEQLKEEFVNVIKLHEKAYEVLGIKKFTLKLSTWDPDDSKGNKKFVYDPENWSQTEAIIRQAAKICNIHLLEGKGDGAFYGPKIDIQLQTVTGREETASTAQIDFVMPKRLNLTYISPDNKPEHPYIIHRAPLGTHERFVAFLIEHFGGAFPTWLAPVQIMVIPVSEKMNTYAQTLVTLGKQEWIRIKADTSSETLGKKLRSALSQKIPHIFIVGEKEQIDNTVTWRQYQKEQQSTLPSTEAFAAIVHKIKTRSDVA